MCLFILKPVIGRDLVMQESVLVYVQVSVYVKESVTVSVMRVFL
jgi:hypothetical protein